MCHVRENYPLNWTKKERAVRNKNGIRKERSWRKSWRALNGILYAKHAWQFLPSPKRVFFLPVFVVIVKRYFSNESPLYSCFSPLLFVILFSFQTINFHEGKNKRGNTSLRNSRYRLRLGKIPALTKIRSSSRRKIHPQPVKEKPVPRLFIGGSIVVPFVLSFPPIYTVRSRETHDCSQHFRHRR